MLEEGQEEVALEGLVVAPEVEALEVPAVPAVAQGEEALEVLVPAEAEEEAVVLEVIKNHYLKAWFDYLNQKCKSIYQ